MSKFSRIKVLSRREFLFTAAVTTLGAAATAAFFPLFKKHGALLISYELVSKQPANASATDQTRFGCAILELDRNKVKAFETPFSVHYVEPLAESGRIGLGTEKYGPHSGIFDLESGSILRIAIAPKGLNWLGHTATSDDGRYVCATCYHEVKNRSYIAILDRKLMTPTDTIELPFANPHQHDCRFLPQSHTLITTGGQSILSIDLKTKRISKVKVPSMRRLQSVRHFGMSPSGQIAIQANVISDLDKPIWRYEFGQIASFDGSSADLLRPEGAWEAVYNREVTDFRFRNDGRIFGNIASATDAVMFWDFTTKKLIQSIAIDRPGRIGLTNGGGHFVIVTRNGVRFVDTETLTLIPEMDQFQDEFKALFPADKDVRWSHISILT